VSFDSDDLWRFERHVSRPSLLLCSSVVLQLLWRYCRVRHTICAIKYCVVLRKIYSYDEYVMPAILVLSVLVDLVFEVLHTYIIWHEFSLNPNVKFVFNAVTIPLNFGYKIYMYFYKVCSCLRSRSNIINSN